MMKSEHGGSEDYVATMAEKGFFYAKTGEDKGRIWLVGNSWLLFLFWPVDTSGCM